MSKLPGQDLYCDTNSIIHRLDARFKILASLVLMIVILNASTPLSLALCVVTLGVLLALTRIRIGSIMRAVLPLVFFVVISALLNLYAHQTGNVVFTWNFMRITDDGIHASLFFGCRMIVVLLSASIIPLSTSTLDISDATERLMMPLTRFKVPAHEIGIMLGIVLRFLPELAQELHHLYAAQISRGVYLRKRSRIPLLLSLLVPLFTSALRHADALSGAMEARCFAPTYERSRLYPFHMGKHELIAAGIVVLMSACILLANLYA